MDTKSGVSFFNLFLQTKTKYGTQYDFTKTKQTGAQNFTQPKTDMQTPPGIESNHMINKRWAEKKTV